MRKALTSFVVLLLLLAVHSTAKSQSVTAVPGTCSLTMGWEAWPPYQYIDEQNKLTGFDIELISAILEGMGCAVTFKQVNWARGLVEVRSGELDLLPHADFTEERSAWAHFSDSYRDASQVLYIRKQDSGKFPLTMMEDIIDIDFRLGVGRGVFIGDRFPELMENPEFEKQIYYIPTDEMQQYRMLQAGRIDGYIRSVTAMDSLKAELGDGLNLELHPLPILTSRQHVIFSRVSVDAELVEKFNASFKSVVADGILRDIESRFLK